MSWHRTAGAGERLFRNRFGRRNAARQLPLPASLLVVEAIPTQPHALLIDVAADKPPLESMAGDRRGEGSAAGIDDQVAGPREVFDQLLENRKGLLPVVDFFSLPLNSSVSPNRSGNAGLFFENTRIGSHIVTIDPSLRY